MTLFSLYSPRNRRHILTCKLFQLFQRGENFRRGLYHGVIAKSKFIASQLVESISSEKSDIFTFVCYINFKEDSPISIEFFPFSSYESFRRCTYYALSTNSQIARLDNKLTKKNIGMEYYCRNCLVAITHKYIYRLHEQRTDMFGRRLHTRHTL